MKLLSICAAGFVSLYGGFYPHFAQKALGQEENSRYQLREDHSRDGIGKFYMGREIAHVMGHQGSEWLERPEREEEERPGLLVDLLELRSGQAVADIGAGTGYFTRRLARKVTEEGKVYAVDIQPEMLEQLREDMGRRGINNVQLTLGAEKSPRLPKGSVDMVLMVDVYHEFSFPYEMMTEITAALRPGGRVALVEYRAEDPAVPIRRLHKMSEEQARKEMAAVGLEWKKTISDLPRQHLMIFEKAGSQEDAASSSETKKSGQ